MKIAVLRLEYIRESPTDPSQFTMLVRAIPRSPGESYSESVTNYFSKYHESTYLAHQMVHRCGRDQNPMVHISLKLAIFLLIFCTVAN
jgi:hypothetical protein